MYGEIQTGLVGGQVGPFIYPPGRRMNLSRMVLAAAVVPLTAGLILFGLRTLDVVIIAAAGALLGEVVWMSLMQQRSGWPWECSLCAGVVMALTLPADASWGMAMLGGVASSVVGYGLFGGYGNHMWHPALVGRVVVQVFYGHQLTPESYGVLGKGQLLWGNLADRVRLPSLQEWWSAQLPMGVEAWEVVSPLVYLRRLAVGDGSLQLADQHPMQVAIRDYLPDWGGALLGLVGGGMGETCVVALLGTGLWLIHRGVLRWELSVSMLAGAALGAFVLPIPSGGGGRIMFPGLEVYDGVWVGAIYVSYHLICGELMLCATLLAADSVTTPLTKRGQIAFGAGVGLVAMVLRQHGVGVGAGYWAMLLMNTSVPVIDRWTKRRVLGA